MDKQFDFRKVEDQAEFRGLKEEDQKKIVDEARDKAAEMQSLVGAQGPKEDYELADDIINDIDKSNLIKEISGLEGKLIDNKKKARAARNEAAREVYEEKVALYEQELQQKRQAVKEIEREQKEKERKHKFNEFLKGEFNGFHNDQFETLLPGVDRLVIQRGPADQDTGEVRSLIVMPFGSKNYHKTFTISEEGALISDKEQWPKEFNFTEDDLYDEVLDIAESLRLGACVDVGDEILPPDDWQFPKGDGPWEEQPTDRRRIRFMIEQPNLLFWIKGLNSSFRGYYGFVFPNFLVLENNKVGNAAYFFDFESPLEVNKERLKLPIERRMNQEERNNTLRDRWKPISNLTKSGLKSVGAEDKRHPAITMDDEHWEEIMQAEIDSRS